ncbi:MFS transporter [Rhodopirellula sp.]|nr:MFS transporter [Rubripirellula sp.]MDA7873576.1 MFS transporter [Rhodopirellula sp.]MDA7907023.1 MFS transporter [bacterium]MDA7905121.1 MFS transporter [Rhodopirellula sp.]MDB4477337.1 MFS transporter [Rhodopirellula sp.]MDB4557975.1 MFS transporter [bacterium]
MTNPSSDRLYDRNFWLAFVSQTFFVSANTLMAHYSRWIEFLGGTLSQVGIIMGVGALLGLVLRPWMAQWINRLGARVMWACGLVFFSLSALTNLFLESIDLEIFLVRSGLVMGSAIVFASGLTYISQTSPESRKTEAIGIFGIGGFLGMLTGPFVGDLFLANRLRDNFEMLFLVAAIANALPLVLLYFLRPTVNEGSKSSLRLSDFVQITRRHWPGSILLVDFAFGVCMTAPFIFVASFIDRESLDMPGVSVIGLFFLFYAGVAIIVRLLSRRLPDRIGSAKVLLWGVLLMSIGMFCFSIVHEGNPWLISIPAILTGAGHSLMFHTMTSLTLQPFPIAVRGTGSAIALMMLDLGTFIGAPVLGFVGESYGFSFLFATIGGFNLLSGLTYGWFTMRKRDGKRQHANN